MTTLADLFTTLETRGVLPGAKDKKTALRYLAKALGYPSLEECPVDRACLQEATWGTKLDAHFQQLEAEDRHISGESRRNVRNNLRVIFRAAEAHGVLVAPLPPRLLTRRGRRDFERQQLATAPYQATYRSQVGPRPYGLRQAKWPDDIQEGWRAYRAKCGYRLRDTTLQTYVRQLENYLGYLAHVAGHQPCWADVFDDGRLREFVQWHGTRVGRRLSTHGRDVVMMAAAMAKVMGHPHARTLADLRNGMKAPTEVHIKDNHMVSLKELDGVAEACLAAGRAPLVKHGKATRYPGARRASRFQQGVILKLLVWVPLRKRNLREMRLGEHLYQDRDGAWQLRFRGDDLKIGSRGSQPNVYAINLSQHTPPFIPVLEEFLREWRPRFPGATTSPFVFLTKAGRQFTERNMHGELATVVAMHTGGKRFYPHLIRTIWATWWIEKTQDYGTAATMLGDTLKVVLATYYHLDIKQQQAKASAVLSKELGPA